MKNLEPNGELDNQGMSFESPKQLLEPEISLRRNEQNRNWMYKEHLEPHREPDNLEYHGNTRMTLRTQNNINNQVFH